jgi:SAM-dependent methyltransferase
MVTCQTVLIHVRNPVAVIKEMLRVLAPGGLLALVEPNNLAVSTQITDLQKPVSEHIALLEFQMICERGKMNLGGGFNSVGPFVAGWLSELGVEDIESYLSDKTTLVAPPYTSAHEQAMIKEWAEMNRRAFWIWNRDDALRYFVAGGGRPEMFAARWDLALAGERDQLAAVERGVLRANHAPACLLISGRKKSA